MLRRSWKLTKNDRTRSLSVKIRQKFNSEAIHGVSISVNDESTLETLADLDEVVEFHPITIVPAPKPMKYFTANDKLKDGNLQPILPHAISGVSKLHEQFQNYGKGVRIAVVDSGIDYNHPTLGGCFRTDGCKIEDGYDFVGDSYGAADPIPKPDNDPYDGCPDGGHGTHVAGIIAGNSSGTKDSFYTPVTPFLGVAPQATLLIYRVGGCPGEIGSDVFAQAILAAYEAKADIITTSIGSNSPYPTDIFTIAVDYVTSKGVYTTVCAGNEGEFGIQTIVTPSIATAAISVASVDNTHTVKFILIAPNGRKIPYLAGQAFSNDQSNFQSKIVVNDPDRGVSDGCNGPKISVAGVVVLFANNPNDVCTISERCMKAAEAGAIGCLIDDPSLTGAFITVPNGIISLEDAQFITKTVSKNPNGIYQFTNSLEMISMATSVKPSIFTSIGPRIDLEFKPDIGAVGGFVYSTVTTNVAKYLGLPSAYAVWSGTSMSTPYMAGVLALFLSHIGNPAPSTVDGVSSDGKCRPKPSVARDLFQSTSKILKDDDSSLVEPPLRQGAGFVDAYYAITTKAFFSPAKLSLNDTVNKKESYTVRLFNIGQQPARYKLSHQGAPMTTGMEPNNDLLLRNPVYTEDYADVKMIPNRVEIQPGESQEITLRFKPPKNAKSDLLPYYSGFIHAKNQDNGEVVHLSYIGVVGDYEKARMIVRQTPSGIVTGLKDHHGNYISDNGITTVNCTQGALIILVFAYGPRVFATELVPADKPIEPGYHISGQVPSITYISLAAENVPRNMDVPFNSYVSSSYDSPWDGQVLKIDATENGVSQTVVQLPPGQYRMLFEVAKNFGRATEIDDFELYATPVFDLVY